MSFSRDDLYSKRVQVKVEGRYSQTFYVDGKPKCLRPKNGEFCSKSAGYDTGHFGKRSCKYHGGSGGRPMKSGQYSYVAKDEFKKTYEAFINHPELRSLIDELALTKTLLGNTVEKYQQDPNDLEQIELILKLTSQVSDIVMKLSKIENSNVLTAASAHLMMVRAVTVTRQLYRGWFPEDEADQKVEQFMLAWQSEVQSLLPE